MSLDPVSQTPKGTPSLTRRNLAQDESFDTSTSRLRSIKRVQETRETLLTVRQASS